MDLFTGALFTPGGPVRRLLAIVVSTVVCVALVAPVGTAHADASPVTVTDAELQPGWTSPVLVDANSASPITKITVRLRPSSSATPIATVADFRLTKGSSTSGSWQSDTKVALQPGYYMADLEFIDAVGHDVTVKWPRLLTATTPARFDGFAVAPADISVDHIVTFSGRGVYADAQGVDQPAKKQYVNFYLRTPARTLFLGQAHTDDLGNLSGSLHIDQSGTVLAQFAAGFLVGSAPETPITVSTAQTRLSATLDTQPTTTGQQVTISGKLERLAVDGTWQPLPNRAISCTPACSGNQFGGGYGGTGRDGTFKLWTVTPASGTWTVSFDPAGQAFTQAQTQLQVSDPSVLQDYTNFDDITVDSTHVMPGGMVQVSARLVSGKTLPGSTPLPNAHVWAYFMPDGGNTSTQTISATTDASGRFSFVGGVPQPGTWSLSFLGDAHHVQSQYAATPHIAVWGRSSVSSFKATPSPVRKGHRLTITGYLTSFNGSTTASLVGARVVIYFRAKGTNRWTEITTVTAGRDGKFTAPTKALKSGSWKSWFAGDANNLAVTSTTIYTRVTS